MRAQVDAYLINGCGRCPLGGTEKCKVRSWQKELVFLRSLLLECGLEEELKWSVPCYTFHKSNVLLIAAFKEYCAISFFKGVLLQDEQALLQAPGEHTQAVRLLKFNNLAQVLASEKAIREFVRQAIELEPRGTKAPASNKNKLEVPDEFQTILKTNSAVKAAFEALPPGKQRGYLLYFSSAKQSNTRASRIDKCLKQILKGKGLND